MRYHLITYGCQMNIADADEMARPLRARGIAATDKLGQADVVIMNSCTVRQHAEDKALSNLGRLRRWKAQDPNRILIFAGCAATLWGERLKKKFPFVDLVSPATRIEDFPRAVTEVIERRWNWHAETAETFRTGEPENRRNREPGNRGNSEPEKRRIGETASDPIESPVLRFTDSPVHQPTDSPVPRFVGSADALFGDERTAYVTIMRGCNYRCSYCIVPQVRGREAYRPMDEILDDVRAKAAGGFRDVMLLGQTVNSYFCRSGEPENRRIGVTTIDATESPIHRFSDSPVRPYCDFADLLAAVDAVDGVQSIRFMSPHPKHMRERVIQAMAASKKVSRHIHLPVQSGSDRVLKRMRRHYTHDEYAAIVSKLRAAMPGILITTDLIVGFPGEEASDFDATLQLMDEIRFDRLFAFMYSPRPGTDSAALADDVSAEEKEKRLQRVLALNRQIMDNKDHASVHVHPSHARP